MLEETAPVLYQLRPPSRLESLPIELIQNIFLRCLEFNLPRSSIYLARALSDRSLYTWIMRLAFTGANSAFILTQDYIPPPLNFFSLSKGARCDLQNSVLDCRWCTLPLIREIQREYMKRIIAYKRHDFILEPEHSEVLSDVDHFFDELIDQDDSVPEPMQVDLILPAKIPGSKRRHTINICFNTCCACFSGVHIFDDAFRYPSIDIFWPVRIPDKLLRPPWTNGKLEFLRMMLLSETYIDEDLDRERSKRVLKQVIQDRDFTAFQQLLNMRACIKEYKITEPWPLMPSHFRLALKYADDHNDPFIQFLVERRWHDAPNDFQLKDALLEKYR